MNFFPTKFWHVKQWHDNMYVGTLTQSKPTFTEARPSNTTKVYGELTGNKNTAHISSGNNTVKIG